MILIGQILRIFSIHISIVRRVGLMSPDGNTQESKRLKQVVGDLLMLQGPGRGEIWEGAADDRLQSRRTHRSQVETTVGQAHCHFLRVHVYGIVHVHV